MVLYERKIISRINKFIDTKDVIVLHGARQVGKTSVFKYLQNKFEENRKTTVYIDLEDFRFVEILNKGYQNLIQYLKEQGFLKKKKVYLFIDEIQYLQNPTSLIKLIHDHYSDKIKLFVSGSSSFEIKNKFKESLAGRTVNFELYPLNFNEFLLFRGYRIDINSKIKLKITIKELQELYKEYVLYGGYPKIVLENEILKKETYIQQIIDTYIRKDIRDLANIKDILKFNKLLEILSSQSGNLLNILELSNTARLSRQTIENYIFLMENTYILKLLYPFSTNLRSELFKTPKIFFYDTGILNLLWLKTLPNTLTGNMFETSIFSELIKNRVREELFFWRTQDKKEIDFIIRKGRKLHPVEIKISNNKFSYTAMNYFIDKYKLKKGICVCLDINNKTQKNIDFKYPWEFIYG